MVTCEKLTHYLFTLSYSGVHLYCPHGSIWLRFGTKLICKEKYDRPSLPTCEHCCEVFCWLKWYFCFHVAPFPMCTDTPSFHTSEGKVIYFSLWLSLIALVQSLLSENANRFACVSQCQVCCILIWHRCSRCRTGRLSWLLSNVNDFFAPSLVHAAYFHMFMLHKSVEQAKAFFLLLLLQAWRLMMMRMSSPTSGSLPLSILHQPWVPYQYKHRRENLFILILSNFA